MPAGFSNHERVRYQTHDIKSAKSPARALRSEAGAVHASVARKRCDSRGEDTRGSVVEETVQVAGAQNMRNHERVGLRIIV